MGGNNEEDTGNGNKGNTGHLGSGDPGDMGHMGDTRIGDPKDMGSGNPENRGTRKGPRGYMGTKGTQRQGSTEFGDLRDPRGHGGQQPRGHRK